MLFIIVGGLYHPIYSAGFGLGHIIGRALYSYGYAEKGPLGRVIGVTIIDICLVANFVLTWITCIQMILGL